MLDQINALNLWVITDFDRTFTKWNSMTAFGALETSPSIPNELKELQIRNLLKYRPIELNLEMDPEERNKHMRDWHDASMEAFYTYLTQEKFEDVLTHAAHQIELRDGMVDFAHRAHDAWVPLLINSAWISSVIERVFDHHGIPRTWIQGNSLKFDTQGRFAGLSNQHPVHIDDKVWSALPQDFVDVFAQRTHFLVMGDAIWDVKMWPSDRNVFNVWFLLKSQKAHERKFRDTFHHIIESDDCDKGFLTEISHKLK